MSRARVAASVWEAVGRTPLVRLERIDASTPGVRIFAKLEYLNPGGSVKDRPAHAMLAAAEARGALAPGVTIIDSTSGNTGVALALYGAARGYPVCLVMPENVSQVRKEMLRAFGAQIIFSDPMEGSDGAIRKVREVVRSAPDRYFYADQYSNPANPGAHAGTTALEIIDETHDRVTHFVAGIGTSGTVMGTGRRLKEHRASIQVIGVEPEDQFHGLEGLKHLRSSIVPAIYRPELLDRTMYVETDAGWDMSDRLAREEGLQVGHSSGAAAVAAARVAHELAAEGREGLIVTVFPDHASRYVEPRP